MEYTGVLLVGAGVGLGLIAKLVYNKFVKNDEEKEEEKANGPKLCMDCKWCVLADPNIFVNDSQYKFATCTAPQNRLHNNEDANVLVNPILGDPEYDYKYCSSARKKYDILKNCGPKGKWFRPKTEEGK